MNYIELIILIVIIGIIIFIKNYSQKIIEHFGFIRKTFRKIKRGVKKVGKKIKKTAKKVGKKVGKGLKKGLDALKKLKKLPKMIANFIKSLPKKISGFLRSIISKMKNGITKGLSKAFNFVLTTIGKILETIFGPIFTPLMPYFWAIGIGFGFLILTCIGSALYIYTRPSPQIGGFVKNNIELFNIIFILLLSIFIFSRQKIEHFGFFNVGKIIKKVVSPIKKTFSKIIKGVLKIIKKLLKVLKDNTIGRLKKMIKIVIVEIQEFLKPALIGFAILPIIGIIAVIGGTIFFYGSNDKPAQKPTPTPTPAPASAPAPAKKPVYIPVPIATPPTPTPVV